MFRHSCGNCHFCNLKRPSDITIADFWGWEKTGSQINTDDKGLNLVLINTLKGQDVFELIKDKIHVIDAYPEAYMQPNLKSPSHIHRLRMQFENDYKKRGFEYILNKNYPDRSILERVSSKFFKLIRK